MNGLEFGAIKVGDLLLQEPFLRIQNFMMLQCLVLEITTTEIMKQIGVKNGKAF